MRLGKWGSTSSFARNLLLNGEGNQIVFLHRGQVLESGGPEIFESAVHPRVQEFIGQRDIASLPPKQAMS